VHYFFYKNVAAFGGQLFYAFYNNYSIQTLYDSFNLTFFNIFWTSLPIFVFALLEKNLSTKTLLNNPVFYRRIAKNYLLSYREFFLWFLYGLWHAIAIFFGWLLLWSYTVNESGMGQVSFGLCVYSTVVTLVNLKLWFQSRSWNIPLIFSFIFSVSAYIGLTLAYDAVRINTGILNFLGEEFDTSTISTFPMDPDVTWVYFNVLSEPAVWLHTVLLLIVALLPDVVIRVFRKHWYVIKRELKIAKKRLQYKMNRGSYELHGVSNPGFFEHDDGISNGKLRNINSQQNAHA